MENQEVEDGMHRYRFMPSILKPATYRGMYIKGLEGIAPNAYVPFIRLVMTAGIFLAGLLFIWNNISKDNGAAFQYNGAAGALLLIALILLLVVFMMSANGGSMLGATFKYTFDKFAERARSNKDLTLKNVGIAKISPTTGEITFRNGDMGVVYAVKGMLSTSTLPSAANYVDMSRARYYKTRTATGQEQRITTIAVNELNSQRDKLESVARRAKNGGLDATRAVIADMQLRYLNALIDNGRQLTMEQTVIVRDTDRMQMQKSINEFERNAPAMYDRVRVVTNRDEIIERLGAIVMFGGVK
jgi:hypothetical protein